MAHCGYEATAVEDMLSHPIKALLTSIRGPKTEGAMAPEVTPEYAKKERSSTIAGIPVRIEIVD